MDDKALEKNKVDIGVALGKSLGGVIPFAGAFLGELIANYIPDQRIDRLGKYVIELEKRVSKIDADLLSELKVNGEAIDLIEEGFVQSARAFSNDRRIYIASIVANGLTSKDLKFQESKYLLKLLQDLSDFEIALLISYRSRSSNNILQSRDHNRRHKKQDFETSLETSYIEHLKNLNLIYDDLLDDGVSVLPILDVGRNPKINFTAPTALGEKLLRQIGI